MRLTSPVRGTFQRPNRQGFLEVWRLFSSRSGLVFQELSSSFVTNSKCVVIRMFYEPRVTDRGAYRKADTNVKPHDTNVVVLEPLARVLYDRSMLNETQCPRCGQPGMKTWDELSRDESIVAERLPGSAKYSRGERKKHRFCTRCWFESRQDSERPA